LQENKAAFELYKLKGLSITRHYSCIPHIAVHKDYRCRVIAADIITALFESTEADSLQILHVDRSRQQ
ncbi:MAG: hypothetical protein ACLRJC_07555, partial [Emergencia timonensis]